MKEGQRKRKVYSFFGEKEERKRVSGFGTIRRVGSMVVEGSLKDLEEVGIVGLKV